jgi:cytochrome c biogenesis protein
VRFEGVDRFISLQIAHEPGRQLVLVASIAALIGLLFGLFVPRRRIWLKVTNDTQKKTVVEVAGLSRQGYAGLSSEIAEMLGEVRRVK